MPALFATIRNKDKLEELRHLRRDRTITATLEAIIDAAYEVAAGPITPEGEG